MGSLLGTRLSAPYVDRVLMNTYGYFLTETDGTSYYIIFSTSEVTNWRLLRIIPQSEVLKEITTLRNSFFLIILLYSVFLVFLSFIFSRGLTKPIDEVIRNIVSIGEGKLDTRIDWKKNDEIGRLASSVTAMAMKIKTLLERVTREEANKNKAELKALQMQLSPHFIYNTLDTVKWMAVINGQHNIKEMISSLIHLMRATADLGSGLITIEKELSLIRSYVYIQKMRYTGFSFVVKIPQKLMHLKINKFIMQNIIENSIVHGLKSMESGGIITIEGEIKEKSLFIHITDNGCGFNTENLDYHHDFSEEDVHTHTGLKSVHSRIVLHHGTGYGVTVWSKPGKGTKIRLKLPVLGGE